MRQENEIVMKGSHVDLQKAISILNGINTRGRHAGLRSYVLERAKYIKPGRSFVFSAKSQKISVSEAKSISMSVWKEIRDKKLPFVIRSNHKCGIFVIFRKDDYEKMAGKKKA